MKILKFRIFIILTMLFSIDIAFAQNSTSNLPLSSEVGQLKLESTAFNFSETYIVVDDNYNDYKKIEKNGIVSIPTGKRKITIIFKEYDDYTFFYNIKRGKLNTQKLHFSKSVDNNKYGNSSYFWIKTKVNAIIKTDFDTEIFIDGKLYGKEIVKVELPLGEHKVLAKNLKAGTIEKVLVLTSKKLTIADIFTRPKKSTARWISFFPGASQFYKKQYIKSGAYFVLIASSIALAIKYQSSYSENISSYESFKFTYLRTYWSKQALINGDRAEKHLEASYNDAKLRDIFFYSAIGLYLSNIVDGLFCTPKGGYRRTKESNLLENVKVSISRNEINVGLFYSF